MAGSTNFPCTVTLAGKQTTEIFTLAPTRKESAWKFDYKFACNLGSAAAARRRTRFMNCRTAPGSSCHKVVQGHHGSFSHVGGKPMRYAIDWKMPEGTPVYVARDGLVVKSEDDSDEGGTGSGSFQQAANCVLIQHDDGTIGIYGHLKKTATK